MTDQETKAVDTYLEMHLAYRLGLIASHMEHKAQKTGDAYLALKAADIRRAITIIRAIEDAGVL